MAMDVVVFSLVLIQLQYIKQHWSRVKTPTSIEVTSRRTKNAVL